MSVFPVIMSMAVTFTSSVSILGFPAEVYLYGIEISFMLFGIIGAIIIAYTWVPVFYELKLTSLYHYFLLRYGSKGLKYLGAVSCTLTKLAYAAIVILGPSQALESVLGIPAVYGIIILSAICVIYTSIGGLRGVVWTDVFQSGILITTIIVIIAMGASHSGESSAWYELQQRNRTILHYSPNPFQRSSIWIALYHSVNLFVMLMNQDAMLRFTSVGSLTTARLSVLLGGAGIVLLDMMAIVVGIIIYAFYSRSGCGPLASGEINSPNQILPFFIKNVLNYPGVPGIFVAALVAGGLSSASSSLNAVAVVLKDIMYPILDKRVPCISETVLLKLLVAVTGVLTMSLSFIAMYTKGTLIQIIYGVVGVINGPVVALFIVGLVFPFISFRAAIAGYICSLLYMLWIAVGKLFYGTAWESPKYIEDTCSNITLYNNTNPISDGLSLDYENAGIKTMYSLCPFAFYSMSLLVSMAISLLVSTIPWFKQQHPVNRNLLFPFVRNIQMFDKYMVTAEAQGDRDGTVPLKSDKELSNKEQKQTEKQQYSAASIML